MKSFEEKLYDKITDSAKKEFDYSRFRAGFDLNDEYDETIADNILWGIINRLIIDTPKERIAYELYDQLLLTGLNTDVESLKEFVSDKDVVFRKQVGIAKLATQMLNNGRMDEVTFTQIWLSFFKLILWVTINTYCSNAQPTQSWQ